MCMWDSKAWHLAAPRSECATSVYHLYCAVLEETEPVLTDCLCMCGLQPAWSGETGIKRSSLKDWPVIRAVPFFSEGVCSWSLLLTVLFHPWHMWFETPQWVAFFTVAGETFTNIQLWKTNVCVGCIYCGGLCLQYFAQVFVILFWGNIFKL